MTNTRKAPRKVLAENLRRLMDHHSYSGAEVARRAKVDPKTVTNMLNEQHNPDLDNVAAVAAVFQLSLWQLIRPNLTIEKMEDGSVDQLIENYYSANDKGKESILQVAEMAAGYQTKK